MCNTTELHASVMSAVSDGAGKPRAGGITLKLLIDEGILEPGENVLTVEYKSSMTSASLAADGRIHCAVSDTSLLFCAWELQVIPRIHCTKCHAIKVPGSDEAPALSLWVQDATVVCHTSLLQDCAGGREEHDV